MAPKGQGPILIAGQTASGKSALAIRIARQVGGAIINADSMQVYEELQLLTARPTTADMQEIPHALYGHVPARLAYSVGHWLEDVGAVLEDLLARGQRPVIVGGTGLYFKALLEGLSPVPAIGEDVRRKWRQRAKDPGFDLHDALAAMDPQMAARLQPGDRQRLARALEVKEATGNSLLYWQEQSGRGLLDPDNTVKLVVKTERDELYARCDERFDLMMANGALQEVEKLVKQKLDPGLPAMRALGLPPLKAFLLGETTLCRAVEKAKTSTRQYAKRQGTWLRRNMSEWHWIDGKLPESSLGKYLSDLRVFP